ncbi:hypothetical protein BJX66DRAFT_300285 [Aspergillus keveii]|uniref:Uncharacterized protein n=1 Tax=Aspergillus keveii TaxID=714993 RepID=A0ABR4GB55_9EURO
MSTDSSFEGSDTLRGNSTGRRNQRSSTSITPKMDSNRPSPSSETARTQTRE